MLSLRSAVQLTLQCHRLTDSQLPAACRREAPLTANNCQHYEATTPDKGAQMEATSKTACVIDTRSIVLKILPLLVHMYCNSCKHTQASNQRTLSTAENCAKLSD